MKTLILLLLATVAAAKLAPLYTQPDRIPGRYIVTLKEGRSVDATLQSLGNPRVFHKYQRLFPGFAAKLTDTMVAMLRLSDAVEYIEEDAVMRADSVASWGLDRIDQLALPLDDVYNPIGNGNGVDVYILDTGINFDHNDLSGRAFLGIDMVDSSAGGVDCNGHGSHCAGTSVGTQYGVANAARVYAVRVLNCAGSGSTSGIVGGCEWVAQNFTGPSVASMSLGGGASTTLDNAVLAMINAGVTTAVSAGNDDGNACNKSPARTTEAITTGATDDADTRAYFSNYGVCVDIFAPGVDITSAWYRSPDDTNTISGTSMSCPHVAGAAAVLLGLTPTLTPAEVKAQLQLKSIADAVIDPQGGSPNLLLYIGEGSGGGFIPTPVDNGCGGYFNATSGNVSSPWYPSDYENNMDCGYLITRSGNAGYVQLAFNHFELESNINCIYDSLSIYDGADTLAPLLGTYCGTDTPSPQRSTSPSLYLHFVSDSSVPKPGFHATYAFVMSASCGHTFTTEFGSLSSPNYPNKYYNDDNCVIEIEGVAGKAVTLTFDNFDIEKHTSCSYDSLSIYERDNGVQGDHIISLCGSDLPAPVTSPVGVGLTLVLNTDSSVSRTGFKASFEIN